MTETDANATAEHMRRRAAWLRKQVRGMCHRNADLTRAWARDLERFADEIHQEEK